MNTTFNIGNADKSIMTQNQNTTAQENNQRLKLYIKL